MSSGRFKLAFAVGSVLLAMSVAANVALALALYDSFAKLHFGRIFSLGYVPGDSPPRGLPATRPTVTFWGDSRALLWDQSQLAGTFALVDYAHGGITSSQLVLQLQTQPVVPSNFAVVQIGINDLHPLGALGANKKEILDRLGRNVLRVRDALLERSDVVVLTTLFPPGRVPPVRRLAWDSATPRYIEEVNALIRGATDGKRVVLLDAHAQLTGPDSYLAGRFVDCDFFLHVNRDAYSLLNQRLRVLLEAGPPPRS